MNNRKNTETQLAAIFASGTTPRLLLHCCCAPCASYVFEYLSPVFDITAFFFNPNIYPHDEYEKRASMFKPLMTAAEYPNNVDLIIEKYSPETFICMAEPMLDSPEGGARCTGCFELRLSETAKRAKSDGFDYFATTLSVSPHKNAELLNEIGNRLALEYKTFYLNSDFKKRDGYKRSVELSKQYGLYRQSYCGCSSSLPLSQKERNSLSKT